MCFWIQDKCSTACGMFPRRIDPFFRNQLEGLSEPFHLDIEVRTVMCFLTIRKVRRHALDDNARRFLELTDKLLELVTVNTLSRCAGFDFDMNERRFRSKPWLAANRFQFQRTKCLHGFEVI